MSLDAGHFALLGYPLGQDDLEQSLPLGEATIVADAPQLRRLADFFRFAAEQLEEYGPGFDHEHFCDFARVPHAEQQLADIIVRGRR